MAVHQAPLDTGAFDQSIVDRRMSGRVSYDMTLGVAPFDGQQVPSRDQFTLVQGSDFSHSGISFTTSKWPLSDQLVLMLTTQAKTVFAVARIVGCVSERRGDDAPHLEVRCEFERWL